MRETLSRLFRPPVTRRRRLGCERLEDRATPTAAVNLLAPSFDVPSGRELLVPLSLVTPPAGTVNYTARADNPLVTTQLLPPSRSLRLTVSGSDEFGSPFSGDLTLRLFEDLAPLATGRIITLTESGFYDGLTFHRILDGFVAQGGDPNGDGSGGSNFADLPDEINARLTFNSLGLLATANSGDDSANSQFFITDTDLTLAQQPQTLNFNYTIFGQLTGGFDTFRRLIRTPVERSASGEVSRPRTRVVIQEAQIVEDAGSAVLRVFAPAGFRGNTTVTVTADDGTGPSTATFSTAFVAPARNDRAFLGPVTDVQTVRGTPVTFRLTGTDLENDALTFAVRDALNFANNPSNVTVSLNQATGLVTLTPAANFVGTVRLLVGVRDGTARDGQPLTARGSFDTQEITLTVGNGVTLDAVGDTGALNNDRVTETSTPTVTVFAEQGQAVRIRVNGGPERAVPETNVAGQYRLTLGPDSTLNPGPNTITATATPPGGSPLNLAPLEVTFAPRLVSLYTVPGPRGEPRRLTFDYVYAESSFRNEVGVVRVDTLSGVVGGVAPGAAGYAQAVLNSPGRQVLFRPDQDPGATRTLSFNGGDVLMVYLIQNSTGDDFLAGNPDNNRDGTTVAFFSLPAGNPDGFAHLLATDDPLRGQVLYAFEDLTGGGDRDFNDTVLVIRPEDQELSEAIRVATGPFANVRATFQLREAVKASGGRSRTAPGEVGLFVADDADGRVDDLLPGAAGWSAAALRRAQVIFNSGAAADASRTLDVPGGGYLGFYFVPGGTAAGALQTNAANAGTGSPVAFFSFDRGNPDGVEHFRAFNPELVGREEPLAGDPLRLHFMGRLNGTRADFDDVVFTYRVGG